MDSEIKSLIYQDELKIIPLMYLDHEVDGKVHNQIGTTSIDIRLGTSFQVFYPDQYGMIDFTQENNTHNFNTSSKRINLDFIEGITITPGQFILGHSMEYIKLPDYICGNLEGRSSFARLGIEIHMTAGYIDPGFEGVLTFEIYNAGPTTVKLYPGMRIGQIRFEKNNKPNVPYSSKYIVKYNGLLEHDVSQQSKDYEVELIKNFIKMGKS
ncbi:MAG: dCTP deaminase [Ignavibacteria bacterium]|nr:dCTP deaminase [Ignavibacteria bacterium]